MEYMVVIATIAIHFPGTLEGYLYTGIQAWGSLQIWTFVRQRGELGQTHTQPTLESNKQTNREGFKPKLHAVSVYKNRPYKTWR